MSWKKDRIHTFSLICVFTRKIGAEMLTQNFSAVNITLNSRLFFRNLTESMNTKYLAEFVSYGVIKVQASE